MTIPSVIRSSPRRRNSDAGERSSCGRLRTVDRAEVDPFWQDEYLTGGYRVPGSIRQTFLSAFALTNESVNIWTHLLGAILFIVLGTRMMVLNSSTGPADVPTPSATLLERVLHELPWAQPGSLTTGVDSPRLIVGGKLSTFYYQCIVSPQSGLEQLVTDAGDFVGRSKCRAQTPAMGHLCPGGSLHGPVCPNTNYALLQYSAADRRWLVNAASSWASRQVRRNRLALAQAVDSLRRDFDRMNEYLGEWGGSASERSREFREKVARSALALRNQLADRWASAFLAVQDGRARANDTMSSLAARTHSTFSELQTWLEHVAESVQPSAMHTEAGVNAEGFVREHWGDLTRIPLYIFMASAAICMSASATFHWWQVVSRTWAIFLQRLDYVGIAVLIAGSKVPLVFYGFYCRPEWLWTHLGWISVTLVMCVSVGMSDTFATKEYRSLRAGVFVGTGVAGTVSLMHLLSLPEAGEAEVQRCMLQVLGMGALYILGAVLYAFRIPERFFPDGRFDLFFASHQLMHILVVVAAMVHYHACLVLFEWRLFHMDCAVVADG